MEDYKKQTSQNHSGLWCSEHVPGFERVIVEVKQPAGLKVRYYNDGKLVKNHIVESPFIWLDHLLIAELDQNGYYTLSANETEMLFGKSSPLLLGSEVEFQTVFQRVFCYVHVTSTEGKAAVIQTQLPIGVKSPEMYTRAKHLEVNVDYLNELIRTGKLIKYVESVNGNFTQTTYGWWAA